MDYDLTTDEYIREKEMVQMIAFPELLKLLIHEKNISVKKLASEIQMDRTLIQKYMSGSRIPRDYHEVERLAAGMLLLPGQQDALMEAYYRSAYGGRNYEAYKKLKEILEGVRDFRIDTAGIPADPSCQRAGERREMHDCVYHGKLAVEHAFMELVRQADAQDMGEELCVRMMLQPDQEGMLKAVLHAVGRRKITLEHIICLDRDNRDNENIVLLFSVLALALGSEHYRVRYYYDDIRSHFNEMTLLPNMVLVGGDVFLCNGTMDEGMVFHQSAAAEFFVRQYEEIREKTRELQVCCQPSRDRTEVRETLQAAEEHVAIGYFPCVLAVLHERMVSGNAEKKTAERRGGFRCFFSESGIRDFLENGKTPGYFDDSARNLSQKDRLSLVGQMIGLMRAEECEAYMEDRAKIRMDAGISILACGSGEVGVWCEKGDKGSLLLIREISIRDAVYGFEKFVRENEWFMDKETTYTKLERIYQEYKERFAKSMSQKPSHIEAKK